MRKVWLIARTILIEALRRKDLYVIALVAAFLISLVGVFRFFGVAGLHKFFREVSLTVMNWATAIIVILLAARQLPREFETRTIYPLLAKPVTRLHFLVGKLLGALLAAAIAYAVFMAAFFVGQLQVGVPLVRDTFLQMIYLRFLALAIIGALTLMLSTLMTHSATVTVSFLFFVFSEQLTSFIRIYYETADAWMQRVLLVMNYAIPQLALADLTPKVVHDWPPVPAWVLVFWTADAVLFVAVFFAISFLRFRKREI
ncbi:MAG: ABC transporter permease [Candidatus Sumerlaeia bacterium]|nr:ABC transporter permease [Candidatus Sumerlaeia bacterium]